MTSVLATVVGVALLVLAIIDVIQTVFQPIGDGWLSRHLERGIWAVFVRLRRRWPRPMPFAGPVALFTIVGSWVALVVLGAALVYWPHFPGGFMVDRSLVAAGDRFLNAVYFSLVTLSTLGYGDISPVQSWLRIVGPLEAILGIGLLTASISWLLAIYAVLSRTWSLASELKLLRQGVESLGLELEDVGQAELAEVLGRITPRLLTLRSDLLRYPITYYFSDQDSFASLSLGLIYAERLVRRLGQEQAPPALRLRSHMVQQALESVAAVMATRFLRLPAQTEPEHVFLISARHHFRDPADLFW